MSIDYADPRTPAHNLTNATVLQILPSLREETGRAAVNVAYVLIEAGARAIVASEPGPLVRELQSYGAEWVPLVNDSYNPLQLLRSRREIEHLISTERVDVVHAYGAGGAWSARAATAHMAAWLVTSISDVPARRGGLRRTYLGGLARGDRVIVPSIFVAGEAMRAYGIEPDCLTVIPRSADTALFDPAAVGRERVTAMRDAWRVTPEERIVLVPGPVAPWNGQHLIPDVARLLALEGLRGAVFVLVGEHGTHAAYARSILRRARTQGVDAILRMPGHCPDLPAAFAAAEVAVFPAVDARPATERLVAEAQAMGKPVVTTAVGALPENVVVPPRIPAELRTGWVVRPEDAASLARALATPLALDYTGYHAVAARARQFAEYMFSPESVARATRAVYTSLLARDR